MEIYATGNSDEEFWYTNLVSTSLRRHTKLLFTEPLEQPDQFSDDFAADEGVIAKGPFREVQLFIDETLGTPEFAINPIWGHLFNYTKIKLALSSPFLSFTPEAPIPCCGVRSSLFARSTSPPSTSTSLPFWVL